MPEIYTQESHPSKVHLLCYYYCILTYIKTFSHMHQLLLFLANWWISSWRNMALFVQNSGNLVLKYVFIPWRHLDFATEKVYSCHSELENSNNVQVINDGAPRHIYSVHYHCKNGVFQSEFDNVTPSVGEALRVRIAKPHPLGYSATVSRQYKWFIQRFTIGGKWGYHWYTFRIEKLIHQVM